MRTALARSAASLPAAGILAGAILLLLLFAQGGLFAILAGLVLALVAGGLVVVLHGIAPVWLLVAAPILLFVPTRPPFYWFDLVALGLGLAGLVGTLLVRDRRAWDVRGPGLLAAAFLLLPLLGLPIVLDMNQWIGAVKRTVVCALVFFGLRRIVPRERSDALLLALPMAGLFIAGQLFSRIGSVGGLLTTRASFRNFYTNLGWGQSNYVAAVLLLCMGATLVLAGRARSWPGRVAALGALLVQLQAFLPLQSRAATIGLALLVLSIAFGSRGRVRVATGIVALAAALFVLADVSGQALIERFTNPEDLGSWMVRVELWRVSWERFVASPWIGVGLGQGPLQPDMAFGDDPHSSLLHHLMELGLGGGILWVAFIAAVFVLVFRAVPPGATRASPFFRSVLFGLVLGVIANSLVEPTLNGYQMAVLFSWFLAWLALQDPAAELDAAGRTPAEGRADEIPATSGGARWPIAAPGDMVRRP